MDVPRRFVSRAFPAGAQTREPPRAAKRRATGEDARARRRLTRRADSSASQFRSIAAEVFRRESMFQAYLDATRLAPVRVHG